MSLGSAERKGKKQSLTIVVEGAGQERDLTDECRRAFGRLIASFGVGRRPSIVCGGDRGSAFEKFRVFKQQGCDVILLIDSEATIGLQTSPWKFLHESIGPSGWKWLPQGEERDDDCHFMVAMMENWFIACAGSLSIGSKNVRINVKKAQLDRPESVGKDEVLRLLDDVYKRAGQREYKKGRSSFGDLLLRTDPNVLCATCPWAKRFLEEVKKRCASE